MMYKSVIFIFLNLFVCYSNTHTTQMPSKSDDSNPFMELAASILQETMSNQNSGGGNSGNGLAGVASLIGSLMQPDGSSKSNNAGFGAAQIISGISSLMANSGSGTGGGSGGGIDPSIVSNIIEMFTSGGDSNDIDTPGDKRQKRSTNGQEGIGLETILNVASAFMGNSNNVDGQTSGNGASEGLMSLLPMIVQAVNSFSGPEGDKIHAKHKEHAWVLPPFLEKIHVIWDHFANSELAEALWQKSGVNLIFKVYYITNSSNKLNCIYCIQI